MGKKPEGDKGNSPGESGGCGPGPKIPDCANGEKGKLGEKGERILKNCIIRVSEIICNREKESKITIRQI